MDATRMASLQCQARPSAVCLLSKTLCVGLLLCSLAAATSAMRNVDNHCTQRQSSWERVAAAE